RLSAVPTKTIKPLRPFFFLREKRNKKTCPLPPQQRGVLLSGSFKNQQGTGSIFGEITQKMCSIKPLAIFILSGLSSLPKAWVGNNKSFFLFPVVCLKERNTKNKKDK